MHDVLETLMNVAVTADARDGRYIQLTARHWPPYVELLVRAGIAVRHKDDSSRLRLTDFLH